MAESMDPYWDLVGSFRRAQAAVDKIIEEHEFTVMEQCEAEGHTYTVVSARETHEPLSVTCEACGGVWPVDERQTKTLDSPISDLRGE